MDERAPIGGFRIHWAEVQEMIERKWNRHSWVERMIGFELRYFPANKINKCWLKLYLWRWTFSLYWFKGVKE